MIVSIIIPTINEEVSIKNLLLQLQPYREQGHEVIVVDGGSKDKTISIAKEYSDKVIQSQPGRALQMNNGAAQGKGDVLWFLHADTVIPNNAIDQIIQTLTQREWGRFNVQLSGSHFLFRLIEKMMNLRSCLTGIATGDQGIFVSKKCFDSVNGFSELPLMEDIDLSKKLKRISNPVCIKKKLITSSRRWEEKGILSTILLMWRLRFLYWIGVSADRLAVQYR